MPDSLKRTELLPADGLKGKKLGLSVSDSPDLQRLGLFDEHFRLTLGELARMVLTAGGDLYYGGHLQPGGITTFLIEELQRYGRRDRPLKVCLAWTVHRSMTPEDIAKQKETLALFGEILFLSQDGQLLDGPGEQTPLQQFNNEESSRSLTGLRRFMAEITDARIVLGGKRHGFQGAMPGIVEEALLMLQAGKPLYLAGGFGGAALDIIHTLRRDDAAWYERSEDEPKPDGRMVDALQRISKLTASSGWDGYENGLDHGDNRLLAASYRPSEIAALVGKGLSQLVEE